MGLLLVVAGGLHYFFYSRKAQHQRLKFDPRALITNNRAFEFSDQVRDNMFWSLGGGVLFWTAARVLVMWSMANGYITVIDFIDNPIWFLGFFVIMRIWSAFHFYWVHRLLHVPFLYRRVHSLHHRNINVGPWSGLSMHPIEHALYFTSVAYTGCWPATQFT
jgi:Delta7-sterol 5-desaturase